jgi:hypothetical protein
MPEAPPSDVQRLLLSLASDMEEGLVEMRAKSAPSEGSELAEEQNILRERTFAELESIIATLRTSASRPSRLRRNLS